MSMSYTNTTAAVEYEPTVALGMVTNYAKVVDEPTVAVLANKTASLEQPEQITYRSERVKSVPVQFPVRNPGPVPDGVKYSVKLETIDRHSAGTDTIDEPIVATLIIKHPATNTWSNAAVAAVVRRLLSACLKDQTTSGSAAPVVDATDWRFEDLMKSALVPTSD